MTNSMTPTEQDKELVAIRQKLYVYLSEAFPDRHFDEEQFEQWLDTRKEFVDTTMQLITADRKRVALEARLDELKTVRDNYETQNTVKFGTVIKWSDINDRIAEIKAQQGEFGDN